MLLVRHQALDLLTVAKFGRPFVLLLTWLQGVAVDLSMTYEYDCLVGVS